MIIKKYCVKKIIVENKLYPISYFGFGFIDKDCVILMIILLLITIIIY